MKKVPIAALLEQRRRSFEDSRNPLYVIEAFLLSDKNLNHPDWVLSWIQKGFGKFFRSRGKRRLDECLGLARRKGQRSWFTEKSIYERNKMLVRKIIKMRVRCCLLVKEACYRIWEKERESQTSPIHGISSRRVKDIYYKRSRVSS